MMRAILWTPLALFGLFMGVVALGLTRPDDRVIRSQLVGKPMPTFSLAAAAPSKLPLGSANLRDGRPHILNIFASWCVPCAAEAPQLLALARAGVPVEGIAIRDRPADVARFLKRYGDAYQRIGIDPDSAVQMALGSSGIPESFVVDGRGVIRHQHVGDIRAEDVPGLIAAVEAAR